MNIHRDSIVREIAHVKGGLDQVANLSSLPLDDDSSGLLREMKLQLIEKVSS